MIISLPLYTFLEILHLCFCLIIRIYTVWLLWDSSLNASVDRLDYMADLFCYIGLMGLIDLMYVCMCRQHVTCTCVCVLFVYVMYDRFPCQTRYLTLLSCCSIGINAKCPWGRTASWEKQVPRLDCEDIFAGRCWSSTTSTWVSHYTTATCTRVRNSS